MHRTLWRRAQEYLIGAILASLAALTAAGCARQAVETTAHHAYIERLGVDTMSVEAYTRTDSSFEGEVVIRSPVTRVAHYRASLNPDGTIARLDVEWRTPPENPQGEPPLGFTVTIEGDSATVERRGGGDPGTTRMAVPPGVIPLIGKTPMAFAVFEQAARQAAASEADSFPVSLLSVSRGRILPNAVIRVAPDSVSIDFFGSPLLAQVGPDGRVLGRTGERTTLKMVGERIADVDLGAFAADFAGRDARGAGLGVASPQATVETRVGETNLRVVYSRPAKRGREIWGALVPYDEIWRTGANAATAFSTDRDVRIGGALVPAGEYTLYSLYTPDSAQLIINRQTGQWGTVYNRAMDLARVNMTRDSLAQPVERFTISIVPTADGGRLQLTWDRTRFSVPLRER